MKGLVLCFTAATQKRVHFPSATQGEAAGSQCRSSAAQCIEHKPLPPLLMPKAQLCLGARAPCMTASTMRWRWPHRGGCFASPRNLTAMEIRPKNSSDEAIQFREQMRLTNPNIQDQNHKQFMLTRQHAMQADGSLRAHM